MKIVFLSIFHLFLSFSLFAEYRGIIQFSPKDDVTVGEIQSAQMFLISNEKSPLVIEYLNSKKDLTKIGEEIEIVSIQNVKQSENNHDVVESDILILFKSRPSALVSNLVILNDNYSLEFKNLKIKEVKKADLKEMVVIDTQYSLPFEMGIGMVILILSFFLIIYFVVKFAIRYKAKRNKYLALLQKRDSWQKIFMSCQERNQFEYIIQNFNRCEEDLCEIYKRSLVLPEKKNLLESFYKNNIDYFYQRSWEQEAHEKIVQSFNLVREVFNGDFRI